LQQHLQSLEEHSFGSSYLQDKGRPVNGGAIVLLSSKSEVTASLDQDGTFRSADIPAGDYKVRIDPSEGIIESPPEGMPPAIKVKFKKANMSQPASVPIPEKYKNEETTDLTVTVQKCGETKVILELED
jgi:hypothetical protein